MTALDSTGSGYSTVVKTTFGTAAQCAAVASSSTTTTTSPVITPTPPCASTSVLGQLVRRCVATPTPTPNPDPIIITTPTPTPKPKSHVAAIAGGAAGGVVALGALIGVLLFCRKRNNNASNATAAQEAPPYVAYPAPIQQDTREVHQVYAAESAAPKEMFQPQPTENEYIPELTGPRPARY